MTGTRLKLSAMMFLQFLIWGAWYPLVFDYLPSMGFNNTWQTPLILGTFNLAALVALFFSTQFVDRNFAAEKFLAFSHLVGGLAILGLFFIRRPEASGVEVPAGLQPAAAFWPFLGLMLVHCLLYVPTISITNSIAFANLKDPQKEFGPVRLWGTIGWIAAAWPMFFILVDWEAVAKAQEAQQPGIVDWLKLVLGTAKQGAAFRQATSYTFVVAGVASLVLAGFSLVLPHTPPKPATGGREALAWLEAMKFLRLPFILVLFIVTFIDAAVHQSYFYFTATYLRSGVGMPGSWVMPIMSIGQIAEIGTMAFLGYVLKRLGWRYTMIIGILGHAGRFAVFAFFPYPAPAILVNVLHGICYAFFFATVYIFVDEYFPKDARASAQGLFNFLILGAGPFIGNFVSGLLRDTYAIPNEFGEVTTYDFRSIFLYPCGAAIFAALLLLLFFHPPRKAEAGADTGLAPGDAGEKWATGPQEGIKGQPTGVAEPGRVQNLGH
jgi:predicted MFS family arabinose efflux permease